MAVVFGKYPFQNCLFGRTEHIFLTGTKTLTSWLGVVLLFVSHQLARGQGFCGWCEILSNKLVNKE
jgi:hypothetical protein